MEEEELLKWAGEHIECKRSAGHIATADLIESLLKLVERKNVELNSARAHSQLVGSVASLAVAVADITANKLDEIKGQTNEI